MKTDGAFAGIVSLKLVPVDSQREGAGIKSAVVRGRAKEHKHSPVEAKRWNLVADALFCLGRRRLDGDSQLLERRPLFLAQALEVIVDGLWRFNRFHQLARKSGPRPELQPTCGFHGDWPSAFDAKDHDISFVLDSPLADSNSIGVRTCVIFNPSARGDKARRFRRHLDEIASQCALKSTAGPGDARKLAAEAVSEGFEIVVAAGGDGTVNEVLNGIGDAPEGFQKARLGVLPLGTVNVFARELGIPARLEKAWEIIRQGKETLIDLPNVEFSLNGERKRRCFAQLAGAGLDARAIELVKWQVKKAIGPLAYVMAGLHALLGPPANISVSAGSRTANGGLILIGNGRLYGGQFRLFPKADLRDGLLEVCVLPRVTWFTLVRCSPGLLLRGTLPGSVTQLFQTASLTLTSPVPAPVQIDGELIGHLPAHFGMDRSRLKVIAPAADPSSALD